MSIVNTGGLYMTSRYLEEKKQLGQDKLPLACVACAKAQQCRLVSPAKMAQVQHTCMI